MIQIQKKLFGFFTFCAFVLLCSFIFHPHKVSGQEIYIKVGEAGIQKSPLVLPYPVRAGNFIPSKKQDTLIKSFYNVLYNDLNVSNYFKILPLRRLPEKWQQNSLPTQKLAPLFQAWKENLSAEFFIYVKVQIKKRKMKVSSYTYRITDSKLVAEKSYEGSTLSFRRLAHIMCNDILYALTGKPGIFLSKIAVVTNHRRPHKELFVMDWDGHNLQQLTRHLSVVLSPQWSPNGNALVYTTFLKRKRKGRNADLLMYDLVKKKKKLLSYRKGLNSGATFHPFQPFVYLTLSHNANPDIYQIDFKGLIHSRLTRGPRGAMNVEPTVSPDGQQIAFSSDRSGRPMIYTMDMKGKQVRRLTFAGRYNAHPAWSPDGKTLAFAGWRQGHFDIYTIDMQSKTKRMIRLTKATKPNGRAANNESPAFSPDGRHILFVSDRTGNKQLFIVSVEGKYEHRITFDKYHYDHPTWEEQTAFYCKC